MLVDPSGTVLEALGLAIAPNLATYGLLEGVARREVPQNPVEVPAVSGALMMVRRAEFLALGGFYEPLWMYGEEADLALRAQGRVVVDPKSVIRHEVGHAAGVRGSFTRVYWPSRNRLINAARHLRGGRFALSVVASAAFDLALIAGAQDTATVRAVARGWRDGVRMIPTQRRSRPLASDGRRIASLRDAFAQQRRLSRQRRTRPTAAS
jgi:GT2 family glycosyltransferase